MLGSFNNLRIVGTFQGTSVELSGTEGYNFHSSTHLILLAEIKEIIKQNNALSLFTVILAPRSLCPWSNLRKSIIHIQVSHCSRLVDVKKCMDDGDDITPTTAAISVDVNAVVLVVIVWVRLSVISKAV